MLAGVAAGAPRLAVVRLGDIPNRDPLFDLERIGYLASDVAASGRLWTAARLDLTRAFAARGFAYIASAPIPPAGLFLAAAPADRAALARLRLAAADFAGARLLTALGLDAAPMGGPTDGFAGEADTPAADGRAAGTIFLDLRALVPREVMVANLAAFDALAEDAKTALVVCADTIADETAIAATAEDAATRAALTRRGIAVVTPGDTLKAELAADGAARLEDWLRRTGVTGRAILDSYRAM